jgi:hypothetical protein
LGPKLLDFHRADNDDLILPENALDASPALLPPDSVDLFGHHFGDHDLVMNMLPSAHFRLRRVSA